MAFILENYLNDLGSKDGSTGGGSTAGVIGAMAAALLKKVLNIQVGKKQYTEKKTEIEDALATLESIQADYLYLIEQDTVGFAPLSQAYSLPNTTDEEKAYRSEAIQAGLVEAAQAPYDLLVVGQRLTEILAFTLDLEVKGSLVNDLLIAANYLEVATETAFLNLKVNTDYLKDPKVKEEIEGQSDELMNQIMNESRRIAEASLDYLAKGSWD